MTDNKDKREKTILILTLINAAILSFGHAYQIIPIIILSFAGFTLLVVFSPRGLLLPIMLFYLPWSPIMKLSPGTYTYYTIIVPFFAIMFFMEPRGKKAVLLSQVVIILTMALIILTLTRKLIAGYGIQPNYFIFILMLILIPTYLKNYQSEISFETSVTFMVLGTISACIASKVLMNYAHMLQFINIYQWEQIGLVRLSGFYGDSNFYSTHILVSIAGLLILAACEKGRNIIATFIEVIILIYFGLLSVSKMMLLVLVSILVLWIISIMSLRGETGKKISIVLTIAFSVLFILTSSVFSSTIDYYLIRFGMVDSARALTTGRNVIFLNYLSYFTENPVVLFWGQGYTNILPDFGWGSHNTIIQAIYQLGISGVFLIIVWYLNLSKSMNKENRSNSNTTQKYLSFMLAVACFIPWLALDMLFFFEFFYISALFFVGYNYINQKKLGGSIEKGDWVHNL